MIGRRNVSVGVGKRMRWKVQDVINGHRDKISRISLKDSMRFKVRGQRTFHHYLIKLSIEAVVGGDIVTRTPVLWWH